MALTVDIVDDDEAVRDSTRILLESYGFAVRDYADAANYLKREAAHSDCLIVDLHMPGMTGIELLEILRSQGKRIPALIMTGHNDPALAPRIAQAGVVKVLSKPIDDQQLVSSIELASQAR